MNIEVIDAKQLIETEPETKQMPIGGLLDWLGLMFLFGPPKIGKSLLLFNLFIVASIGGFFLDTFPIYKPLRVMILIGEGSRRAIRGRLIKMTQVLGMPKEDNFKLVFNRRLRLDNESHVMELIDIMKQHGTQLLGIDPMFRFHAGRERKDESMIGLINNIGEIQEETGAAVVIIHHTVKDRKGKKGGELLRGHGALFASGDTYISMEKGQNAGHTVKLDFDCKDFEIRAMQAKFDDSLVFFAEGFDSITVADAVSLLRKQGGRMRQTEFVDIACKRFDREDRSVRDVLYRAKEIGIIADRSLPGKGGPKELYLPEMSEGISPQRVPQEEPSEQEISFE